VWIADEARHRGVRMPSQAKRGFLVITALSSNSRDSSREKAYTACTRFREPVQPPATGEDRLDRTDLRKGKIMAGSQCSHVTDGRSQPWHGAARSGARFWR
jgi:hypothetical protein